MFIIFGAPRSGTTLLSASLNLNDSIVVPHETDFIIPAAFVCGTIPDEASGRKLLGEFITSSARFNLSIREFLTPSEVIEAVHDCPYDFMAILESLYGRIAQKAGKAVAGDKSPNDIFYARRFIGPGAVLPEGFRIIHIVRDVRAAIASLMKVTWGPQGVEDYFARSWSEVNLYLHHFLKDSPRYLLLKYEEMVLAPEEVFRRVTDFLGVPFQEKMFDSKLRSARYEDQAHHDNLQYDFMPDKVDQWKEELRPSIIRDVELQAREALEVFGYNKDSTPAVRQPRPTGKGPEAAAPSARSRAICILGMHRSGTSAITRAVNLLGPYIGPQEHLMESVAGDNPEGFWEHMPIYQLHERLLSFLSGSWDSTRPLPAKWWRTPGISPYREELKGIIRQEFGGRRLWMWKDPRTALFLPLWKDILREMGIDVSYLLCVRNPLDIAASLKRRNGFPQSKSLALWQWYNLCALRWTSQESRMLVSYDDLLDNWEATLSRVAAFLDIPWPRDRKELQAQVCGFLRRGNRHSHTDWRAVYDDREIPAPAIRLFGMLLDALANEDVAASPSFSAEVERLYRHYEEYSAVFGDQAGQQRPEAGSEPAGAVAPGGPFSACAVPAASIEPMVFPAYNSPRASIIIPAWNHWEYTFRCLQAILANTSGVPYEVIVVDNGSTDRTGELLADVGNIRVIRNQSNEGFVRACNQGADVARGEYLVFLNNDTEPLGGWLMELVDVASHDATAGAVGAKLIFPDGLLQEAGGLIFSDGRGWNFGKREDPDEDIYNILCDVDYCSGACLLVRKELFAALGGFDMRYSPAYYEDADLCFGLRRMGYKVIYNPAACIIHHESVTSGAGETTGFKRYIEINRRKFVQKWAAELMRQDMSPSETGGSPVTSCRERLIRRDLTQEDIIYGLNRKTAALRRRPASPVIDKSVLYLSSAEKVKKTADVVSKAVGRYGVEAVGIAWWGDNGTVALLHILRKTLGEIPVKVISLLSSRDFPEECRFIERLRGEWDFDLRPLDADGSCTQCEVANGNDPHLTRAPEILFRTAVRNFRLKALITAEKADGKGAGSPSAYFSHEDNPRHMRVRPMLHFREVDVWHYIASCDVPVFEGSLR